MEAPNTNISVPDFGHENQIQTFRAPADPLELCFDGMQGSVEFLGLRGQFLDPWKMGCLFVRWWFTGKFRGVGFYEKRVKYIMLKRR